MHYKLFRRRCQKCFRTGKRSTFCMDYTALQNIQEEVLKLFLKRKGGAYILYGMEIGRASCRERVCVPV